MPLDKTRAGRQATAGATRSKDHYRNDGLRGRAGTEAYERERTVNRVAMRLRGNSMNQNKSVALAYNDIASGGTSDKVYFLNLEQAGDGFTVTAQYGRRGGALATDRKTKNGAVNYASAIAIFDKVEREKRAKGYVDVDAPVSRVIQPPTDEVSGTFHPKKDDEPRPQELLEEVTDPEPFIASPKYWMQDKSDGHSRGAVKIGGVIFGLNKTGRRVPLDADLHEELSQVQLRTFQVDAELVGQELVCRDLLDADGDISGKPYRERFRLLVAHFGLVQAGFKFIACVPTWEGVENKRAAFQNQLKERREGVVFKLMDAPHRAGRNGQHKKFKFIKTLSAIAGKPRATGKDSVEIFLMDGAKRIRTGTVSLIGKPKVSEGDILEVAYLYAYPSKKVVQARLRSVRNDVTADECTTAQLIYKRE